MTSENTKALVDAFDAQLLDQQIKIGEMRQALELIAAPKRPDGTYNRSREACEQLAQEVLKKIG